MTKNLLYIPLLLFSLSSPAQDMQRVQDYIDTLTSPHLHGRGYVNKGDSLAAVYIADRFKEAGLLPFKENSSHPYFQFFHLNINTFPGSVQLTVNGIALEAGKDFILNPASGGGNKKLKSFFLDTTILNDPKKQKKFSRLKTQSYALIIDPGLSGKLKEAPESIQQKIYSARAVIELTEKKLTASLSTQQLPIPWFTVSKDKFPGKVKSVCVNVKSSFIKNYSSQNVIGYVPGKKYPDSFFVISAHYDHLGRMGKDIYFPGANDNASGVSMLLELAKYYSENKPDYSIAFMAFGAEEAGLIGSAYYTQNPWFPLSDIKFLLNLDLLGTGDEGIMVVNATLFPEAFNLLEAISKTKDLLPAVKRRGPAPNSDHYYFTQKDVPSFFIYTLGGITAYHDIFDRPETLPLTKFPQLFQLLVSFLEKL